MTSADWRKSGTLRARSSMPRTFTDLLAAVRQAGGELKRNGKISRIWYRGVGNEAHKLLPSLHRPPAGQDGKAPALDVKKLREREKNLYTRYRTRAGHLIPASAKHWDVLSLMQHHGAPTRVLDWTESLFVGLYFALNYSKNSASPRLWLLNPFGLNWLAAGEGKLFDCVDELPAAYDDFLKPGDQPANETSQAIA
jgi:hypothetical protein